MNTKESVYGIIWGVNDVNNYNAYMVSSMGMASVATCRGGRFTKVIDWKKAGNYQNNQVHTLGIRNKGGQMHYYLDGKKVLTSSPLPFYGPLTGFVISGKTTAKIDYLRVQQDRQINLIENAIRGHHKENLGEVLRLILNGAIILTFLCSLCPALNVFVDKGPTNFAADSFLLYSHGARVLLLLGWARARPLQLPEERLQGRRGMV